MMHGHTNINEQTLFWSHLKKSFHRPIPNLPPAVTPLQSNILPYIAPSILFTGMMKVKTLPSDKSFGLVDIAEESGSSIQRWTQWRTYLAPSSLPSNVHLSVTAVYLLDFNCGMNMTWSDTSPKAMVNRVEIPFCAWKVPSTNLDPDTAYLNRFLVSFQANGGAFNCSPDVWTGPSIPAVPKIFSLAHPLAAHFHKLYLSY